MGHWSLRLIGEIVEIVDKVGEIQPVIKTAFGGRIPREVMSMTFSSLGNRYLYPKGSYSLDGEQLIRLGAWYGAYVALRQYKPISFLAEAIQKKQIASREHHPPTAEIERATQETDNEPSIGVIIDSLAAYSRVYRIVVQGSREYAPQEWIDAFKRGLGNN